MWNGNASVSHSCVRGDVHSREDAGVFVQRPGTNRAACTRLGACARGACAAL